jgi:hypothetical protein
LPTFRLLMLSTFSAIKLKMNQSNALLALSPSWTSWMISYTFLRMLVGRPLRFWSCQSPKSE